MSALGHTMASMPRNGSAKPSMNSTPSGNANRARNGPRNDQSRATSVQGANNNPSGKRAGQSMNHLLAFTLPPRARPPPPASRRSKKSGSGVPFNKERYINAQYRFLVKPTGDYTAYFADSDIYLHWADILQVLIPTTSALSGASASALTHSDQPLHEAHEGAACPICLSPPTAPRMTKCGHVFCYPCILHYLTVIDGNASGGSTGNAPSHKWRRCPICWDAVYARDLKAVKWWDPRAVASDHQATLDEGRDAERALHQSEGQGNVGSGRDGVEGFGGNSSDPQALLESDTSRGEALSMRLIERPHLTTLALPQSSTWPSSNLDHPLIPLHSAPWHFQPDVLGFAKFMLASPDLLIESLTGELLHLEQEIETLKGFGADEVSLEFVRLAERKVQEQIQKVQTELDTTFVRSTIGQVKNDLKEHHAMESGKAMRLDESPSRRQRKKLERAHTADAPPPDGSQDQGRSSNADESSETHGAPEQAPGTEEFLALRSQSYGGGLQPTAAPPSATSRSDGPNSDTQDISTATAGSLRPGRQQHSRKNVNPPAPSSSSYLFFQAASGQNIFLHPLDIKIVLSHYGSYAALPRDLTVRVQGADEGSMNDELRRRCKYLSHIPMATDVVFVEVDWESMDLVKKPTLRPYDQALRQRKTKRRDRQRREDRAKTRAEEGESSSLARASGAGGAGGAASAQRYRSEATHFDNEANFPSDGLSRSYGSSSLASGHEDGGGPRLSISPNGASPSFREAALWGAERDFPIHPGASQIEDFPDSLGVAMRGRPNELHAEGSPRVPTPAGPPATTSAKKTVWGTPAARNGFERALKGGQDHQGLWDEDVEDAWHELEEDFILGSTGSGRRPNGAVKEGRGLNRQTSYGGSAAGSKKGTPSGGSTPRGPWAGSSGRGTGEGEGEGGSDADAGGNGVSGTRTPVGGGGGSKPKKAKKKLILTGGGRGGW